jgi:hypothetical protein
MSLVRRNLWVILAGFNEAGDKLKELATFSVLDGCAGIKDSVRGVAGTTTSDGVSRRHQSSVHAKVDFIAAAQFSVGRSLA